MKVGRLALRVTVGSLFVGHGTQKLFGWFGGGGLGQTAENMGALGMRPAKLNATAAGLCEGGGGAALALGYRTPFASAAVISVMLTAIKRVHFKNGPWSHNGGYEYNLVLIAAAMALAEAGPGKLSLDALRGKQRKGAQWGLLALALGAGGATAANLLADRQAAKAAAAATPVADADATVTAAPASASASVTEPTAPEPAASATAEVTEDADADDHADGSAQVEDSTASAEPGSGTDA